MWSDVSVDSERVAAVYGEMRHTQLENVTFGCVTYEQRQNRHRVLWATASDEAKHACGGCESRPAFFCYCVTVTTNRIRNRNAMSEFVHQPPENSEFMLNSGAHELRLGSEII